MPTPSPTASSAFLLLFRNAGPDVHAHLSPAERVALAQRWNDWYDGLAQRGKVKHGQPLELTGRVVSGARGERVTDGPFAEAKEVVGGYIFLTVEDLDEAQKAVEALGGNIILMASRALAFAARGPDDYARVYDRILSGVQRPVILHWLGEMFDPALDGY